MITTPSPYTVSTATAAAITLLTVPALSGNDPQWLELQIFNAGTPAGLFSFDGGTTWLYLAPGPQWIVVENPSGNNSAFSTGTTVQAKILTRTATVTNKALTSNVATLTAANTFTAGDFVTVAISDAVFDGSFTIASANSSTFTYAKTHADVVSASATGTAVGGTPLTGLSAWAR